MKIIPTSSTTRMTTQLLKDRLTIVIPCKNEGVNIYECLGFISKQRGIAGTRVIISDNSDDEESLRWIYQTESDYKYSLKIEVIEGGFPAQARLNGSKLVTTPYMLFLDADIMLFKQGLLETVVEYEKDLVTVPFETETGFNWIFRMFDVTQRLSVFLGTPFAVGGFQLFKTETYWNIGGYNPDEKFAEDYSLSQKVGSQNFKIHKTGGVWTSARRFKNKGVFYMVKILVKSYLNRNNPEFFKKSHGYWD